MQKRLTHKVELTQITNTELGFYCITVLQIKGDVINLVHFHPQDDLFNYIQLFIRCRKRLLYGLLGNCVDDEILT